MRHGTTLTTVLSGLIALLVGPGLTLAQDDRGAEVRLPDRALGFRVAPVLLLSRADVREELGLDADQSEAVQRTIAALQARARELQGKEGPAIVSARRAVDEAGHRWLVENLSSPQRLRLDQVDLQWEGPSALLSRPTVAAALELSADQRAALTRAIGQRDQQLTEGQGPLQAQRVLAEVALRILNEDQRDRWKAMLGPPFQPQLASQPR